LSNSSGGTWNAFAQPLEVDDEDANDDFDDDLTDASNAVLALIQADKLDEAETAARNLLVRYPEVPDGWDRLGMVHEKRGENREAAGCYRKLIAFVRQHPDDFDAEIVAGYAARVAKLDPPAES